MRKCLFAAICLAGVLLFVIPAWALPSAYFALGKKFVKVNTSGTITLPIRLTYPASGSVTVNLTAESPYDTPAYGTEYISGKNYSLSANSVTFSPGQTSKSVTLNILERKTYDDDLHIPFYQEKVRVSLAVDSADTSKARTGSVANKIDVLVSDTVVKGVKNVKTYGAAGDGTTDDSSSIQSAIDAAAALISDPTTDQAVVYFPKGTYRVSDFTVPAGLTLLGEDRENTTITRFGRQWFISQNVPTYQRVMFLVSGITTEPETNVVYQDGNGSKYVINAAYLSGTPKSGSILCARVANVTPVVPPASGTLTKVSSGSGDATISYSAMIQGVYRFSVTGVSEKPTTGSVYTQGTNTFTYLSDSISGGSGYLFMTKISGTASPSTSALTKVSGDGDASISVSDSIGFSASAFYLWVSGVTNVPAKGDEYQDAVSGMNFIVYSSSITDGSGMVMLAAKTGSVGIPGGASGTLNRVTGFGDATLSYSAWDGEDRWYIEMISMGDYYTNDSPSALGGIRNMTINGNWSQFPEYYTVSYTLYEPSFQVRYYTGTSQGQYRALFENVLFTDGISSHLSTVSNARTYIYNSRLQDSVSGKGKLAIVGGHNDMFVRHAQINDAYESLFNCFDIEQNSDTEGYYDDGRYTVTIADTTAMGIVQYTGRGTGTKTFTVTDSIMGDLNAYATAYYSATNSVFYFNLYGSPAYTHFRASTEGMDFTNCTFYIYPDNRGDRYSGIPWASDKVAGATYTFTNCDFYKAGTHTYGDGSSYAFNNTSVSLTKTGSYLVFDGCTFNDFTIAFRNGNGGNFSFKDCTITGCDTFCRLYGLDSTYNFKATFENIQFDGNWYLWIEGTATYSTGNEIEHVTNDGAATTILAREHAGIKGGSDTHDGQYLLDGVFTGKRQITGSSSPTTQDTGLLGDEFKVGSSYWDVQTGDKNNAGYYIYRKSTYDSTIWTAR